MNYYLEKLFSLDGKKAVVTGAARGNGKSIAEALLRAGAEVILVDKLEKELEKTTKLFKKKKLKATSFPCDISKNECVNELEEFVIKKYQRLDILINNAGVTYTKNLMAYTDELWENTYKINLKAPFVLSKTFAKYMIKNNQGVIINITSINAELAFPDNPAYVSFKGALKQLTKSLAVDLGRYGIRVNNIGPGYFRTEMTKKSWNNQKIRKQKQNKTVLGRWGLPKDLAGAVIFLCSDSASYVTGQDLYVDGGWLVKGI